MKQTLHLKDGNDGLIYKGRNVASSLKAAMGVLNGYSTTPTTATGADDPDEGR